MKHVDVGLSRAVTTRLINAAPRSPKIQWKYIYHIYAYLYLDKYPTKNVHDLIEVPN